MRGLENVPQLIRNGHVRAQLEAHHLECVRRYLARAKGAGPFDSDGSWAEESVDPQGAGRGDHVESQTGGGRAGVEESGCHH